MCGMLQEGDAGCASVLLDLITPFSSVASVETTEAAASVVVFFYRATLCVSAVFAVAQCLSVRLSVTLVYCIETAEDVVELFLGPVATGF